jgi:hypothetical protein
LLGVATFALATSLSSSRFPAFVGLLGVIIIASGIPRRRTLGAIASYLAGYFVGVLVASVSATATSVTDRAVSAGTAGRLDGWLYGFDAFLERPIAGWGLGRFRPAVQGRWSPEFTALHARDETTAIWFDAHNVVVEIAVTLGIIGIIAATVFAVLAARRSHGPLAAFAAVLAATWLLEPVSYSTLPLVLIAIGASSVKQVEMVDGEQGAQTPGSEEPADGADRSRSGRAQPAARIAVLLGVLIGSGVLLASVQLREAARPSATYGELESAAGWLPWDPTAAEVVSSVYLSGGVSRTQTELSAVWMRRAVDRLPDRPYYRNGLAFIELLLADYDAAEHELRTALDLQPWNIRSNELMATLGRLSEQDRLIGEGCTALATMAIPSSECTGEYAVSKTG